MTQAKAIIAGITTVLLAGATALSVVLVGDATLQSLSQGQWLAVIIAMLTSGGAVYGITYSVTNDPAPKNAIVTLQSDPAPVAPTSNIVSPGVDAG